MDKRQRTRLFRRTFSPLGWAMVAYYLMLNLCVFGVMLVDELIFITPPEQLSENAWGYLLAITIGIGILISWKGKDFWRERIWKHGRKMRAKTFFTLVAFCLGAQLFASIFAPIIEWCLNLIGLSALASLESATVGADTLSMFLYLSIGAPVAEELLCRGLVQRTLEPYGKRFAIFGSAFLFGLMHGNVIQSPYAFLVGIILGYTACEYSIAWAMLLHMVNNLVFGDMLGRISQLLCLTQSEENILIYAIVILCAVVSVIALIRRYRKITAFRRENPIDKAVLLAFCTSPGVLFLALIMLINMFIGITKI